MHYMNHIVHAYRYCNRLALLLLRTAHAIYLLTFPPEVQPIPSISCVLILVAALSLSTSADNSFIYSSCLRYNVDLLQELLQVHFFRILQIHSFEIDN